jgi:hypothetical protein
VGAVPDIPGPADTDVPMTKRISERGPRQRGLLNVRLRR